MKPGLKETSFFEKVAIVAFVLTHPKEGRERLGKLPATADETKAMLMASANETLEMIRRRKETIWRKRH